MTGLLALVMIVAAARGDEAIVVVDDASACLDEGALRTELPVLPTGSVLSVVVVGALVGGQGAALVKLEVPDDPAPLSRLITIDRTACASVAPIVARIVARHLEDLPVSAWPARVAVEDADDDVVVKDVVVVEDVAHVAHVDVGVVGSVVVGADGFSRVSVRPVVRGLVPVGPVWLGGDVFARVGGLLPVAVGPGRVVGGDLVGGVAGRATWSRWSASVGVEAGALFAQGVGFSKDALATGPTVNGIAAVGMSFSPVWVDVVMQVPLVRAGFGGDAATATETPLYVGIAVGGFVTAWP